MVFASAKAPARKGGLMAVVILNTPSGKRELIACCTYQDAVEWVEAHDNCYPDYNGILCPLTIEDRNYPY